MCKVCLLDKILLCCLHIDHKFKLIVFVNCTLIVNPKFVI